MLPRKFETLWLYCHVYLTLSYTFKMSLLYCHVHWVLRIKLPRNLTICDYTTRYIWQFILCCHIHV